MTSSQHTSDREPAPGVGRAACRSVVAARPVALAGAALLCALPATARVAWAQQPPQRQSTAATAPGGAGAARSPSEVALARAEFQAGVQAFREGRFADALARYDRAYQLVPQPQILLNLAGAQLRVGRLVAAAESYRRFLREVSAGPLAVHRAAARAALGEIEPRIAHVTLAVTGALAPGDQVTLDGEALSSAVVGAALPVDPGAHVVSVVRAGTTEVARVRVELDPGAARDVALAVPPPSPGAHNGPSSGSETAATRPVDATGASGAGASGGAGNGASDARGAGAERAVVGLGGAAGAGSGTPHPRDGARGATGARRGGTVWTSPWFWTGVVLVVGAGATVTTLYLTGAFDPPRMEPPVSGNVPPFVVMAP